MFIRCGQSKVDKAKVGVVGGDEAENKEAKGEVGGRWARGVPREITTWRSDHKVKLSIRDAPVTASGTLCYDYDTRYSNLTA